MPERREMMLSALLASLLLLLAPGSEMLDRKNDEQPPVAEKDGTEPTVVELQTIQSLAKEHSSSAADDLAGIIYEEATAVGIDPLMVAAIVAKESSFRTTVVSRDDDRTVGCAPVMATASLSRISTVMSVSAATASINGVTPEWRKVLSPITATTGRHPASAAPLAMPMEAPMQTQDSPNEKGGRTPRV